MTQREHLSALRRDAVAVFPAWIAARVFVAIAYVWAVATSNRLVPGSRPVALAGGLMAWDAGWYRDIANVGYHGLPDEGLRFFPLLPLLAKALSFGADATVAIVVIATVASFVLAILVRRLVELETSDAQTADLAVWFMMIFPTSFVLVWGYSEGLMLVGAVGMFYALRRRAWWWAAVFGLLASTARPLGLLLFLPAAIEAGRNWGVGDAKERLAKVCAVLSPLVGTGAYLLWVRASYGDAMLPFTVQSPLRGKFIDPIHRLGEGFGQVTGSEHFGDGLHIPFVIGFLILLVLTFRRWPLSYGVYAGAVLLVAISAENLNSLERYGLNAFPLVLTIAVLVSGRAVERFALMVSAAGFVALTSLAWVGAYVP